MNSPSPFVEESRLMRLCQTLGLESVAWSLRRLHCPVDKRALVLEVGSGGNPYFRSNVLLDAYEETRQRHWAPLVADRPTVLGFVERLPFKDKTFDFVIASHVLEHSSDPVQFLNELQRVAKAGYLEVPDAFMERINPYRDHRLEITVRDGQLVIRKKASWRPDAELEELHKHRASAVIAGESIPRHPFAFHVRYYWRDKIDYTILNPEEDAAWEAPAPSQRPLPPVTWKQRIRQAVLRWARRSFSQGRRNRRLALLALLRCPECNSNDLTRSPDKITCSQCTAVFSVRNGIPIMNLAGSAAGARS